MSSRYPLQLLVLIFFTLLVAGTQAQWRPIESRACRPNEFMCNNGQCIRDEQYCDDRPDCYDESDETNCLTTCSPDEYRCLEGICISIDKRCNGFSDCRNGDDEDSCDCRTDDFHCDDGTCVAYSSLCNGIQDCKDGSDEKDCDIAPCPETDFTCGDGSCISKALVCDGIDNCLAAEDELSCERNCTPTQFKCVNGNKCIDRIYRCDGHPDCPDRSDEDCQRGINGSLTNVTSAIDSPDSSNTIRYPSCRNDEFECQLGFCINRIDVCNGRPDCPDSRDERNCTSRRPEVGRLDIRVYPVDQIIKERSEVVIQCRDEGPLRARIRWVRGNGQPLPPGSSTVNGRLEIPNIQMEHAGPYICEAEYYTHLPGGITANLEVERNDNNNWANQKTCSPYEATCNNQECIPKHYICDGKADCADGSDESRCGLHGCEPNEFRCANKQCVSKIWRCDGDKDCSDGSDEDNCSASPFNAPCTYGEFKCHNEQCIPKSYQCDQENDCMDGSDEIGCSAVYITKTPPPMVVLALGETLLLTCEAVGVPTPEINWRLNWGHIPPKCTTSSVNGSGNLTCPDVRIEDQGAYSCEGINVMGFVIAVPDTILVIKNTSICPIGRFNAEARRPEECISCFCFGVATECSSANLYTYQLPLPIHRYKVVPVEVRPEIRVPLDTNYTETVPADGYGHHVQSINNDIYRSTVIYFGLPEQFHGNQLKSYGGYLHYSIKYSGNGGGNEGPAVIITGNDITIYNNGLRVAPDQESRQRVKLMSGDWYKQDRRGITLASREEIMMVLANVNNILIKAQYDNSQQLNVSITNVILDSAANTGLDSIPYVEECRCPSGYSGLSCENCAPGYVRRKSGRWLGQCYREAPSQIQSCPRGYYGDPSRGIQCEACPCPIPHRFDRSCQLDVDGVSPKCDCPPGYEGKQCERCSEGYTGNPLRGEECRLADYCDPSGTLSVPIDRYNRTCNCKEHVTGPTCNQCKPNTFSLAPTNQFGCISCFCMGITNQCMSSNWYRSDIRVSFTNSPRGFALISSNNRDSSPITRGINVKPQAREIEFNDFPDRGAGEVFYWQLPSLFLGDQITAYGGNLKYIVRHVPSPGGLTSRNSAADVELISSNDITLLYYSREFPEPNAPKTITVPLLEQHWQRADGTVADREHLLMALADIAAIRIKATYTTHTDEAALSYVSLDIAEEFNTGRQRAIEVEKCSCPVGYQGLSCEDCAAGYTRAIEGLYLGICEPCRCNGHSSQCDPETGICENCADHTTGNNCEICQSGYEGDATRGTPYDCQVRNGSVIPCHCNPLGSENNDCVNGQCSCKRNVEGAECDRCRYSTFGLSQNNPDGCNECFCSGVTNQCHESSLYLQQIPVFFYDNEHGFTLTDSARRQIVSEGFELDFAVNKIGYRYTDSRSRRLFWSLPSKFTGNKIKSYGGKLSFNQQVKAQPNSSCRKDQDVIIIGNGITLYWTNPDDVSPNSNLTLNVPLIENEWRYVSTNGLRVATRPDLMSVLANVDAILVRASLCDDMIATYMSDIFMDTAAEGLSFGQPRTTQVEACMCPAGYTGTSCETCAPGHYRNSNDRSVSPLGSCVPCPCNGNEQSCELDYSGRVKCNCQPQYAGEFCKENAGDIYPTTTPEPVITDRSSPIIVKIDEPKIIIVKIGESVRFHCSGRSVYNNPVTMRWQKEGGYLAPGRGIDDGNGLLVIRELRISDSGNYICHVTDGQYVNTEKVTLHVGAFPKSLLPEEDSGTEPTIEISPPSLVVIEGEPAEFICRTSESVPSNIGWERSDGRMNENATFLNGVLRIPIVTLDDAANYKCIVSTRSGSSEKIVPLHVRPLNPVPQPDIIVLISPNKWSGFSGDTVRLICNTSSPVQRILWSRSDQMLLPTAATQNNGILTISNPSLSDAGWYICTATLRDGTERSTTTSVQINPRHDMPTVTIEPQRQKVPQGSTAIITCRTEGDESNFKWTKAREPSLGSNVQATGGTLRIANIQMANRGVYTCKFSQGDRGVYEASAILDVDPREMPVLQIYPNKTQTVLTGNTADFHCRAIAGIPVPEIKWSRQDQRPFGSNVQVISSGMLRINNVTSYDEGTYVCVAQNIIGTTSATVTLEVNSYPVISISPQHGILKLKKGARLHLICTGNGQPMPVVSWNKEDGLTPVINPYSGPERLSPSATIDINSVTLADEGTYTCRATSPAGQAEDYVQVRIEDENSVDPECRGDTCYDPPPEDPYYSPNEPNQTGGQIAGKLENVPTGGKVSMRCQVFPYTDDKSIYLDWKREDGRPMSRTSTISDGTLYISNLKKEDSGDYTCIGVDTYGKQLFSTNTRLNVVDSPKIKLEPLRQTVRPGESPSIHCIVTGDPPMNVEWEAVGRPLPSSVKQSNGLLRFYGITFSDAGKYVCKAWNDYGTAEAVAEVSVEASATPIVKVGASKNPVDVGDSVELHCMTSGIINPRYIWSMPYEVSLPWNARESGNILTLTDVSQRNAGLYRCAIDSEDGAVEGDFELIVSEDDLDTDGTDGSTMEIKYTPFGKDIEIQCRDYLEPPGRYRWTKVNGTLPTTSEINDAVLILKEVNQSTAGVYMCKANNGQEMREVFTTVVVNGLVPYFSQAPISYIEVPPLVEANLKFNIEITFRPENLNGILLYTAENHNGDGDFMSLTLETGYPTFTFDLGSGPTIVKADRNISLGDWHTIILQRDRKSGTMIVDNSYTYKAVSKGKRDTFDAFIPLYVGGISEIGINKNVGVTTGFVGCINRLIVGDKKIDLMNNMLVSKSITSCEICEHMTNPCSNGICQESIDSKDGFECICNVGFVGARCENTKQSCQPGICGEGMCHETEDGYECDCPIGKTGPNCEYSQMIRTSKLSHPRSYLGYQTPKSIRRLRMSVSLKPAGQENGILMYCAQSARGTGDFIALVIHERRLRFLFGMGARVNELRSNHTMEPGKWHRVSIGKDHRWASLTVNAATRKKLIFGPQRPMYLKTLTYFGGVDHTSISIHKSLRVKLSFNGCLDKIHAYSTKFDMFKSIAASSNVEECNDFDSHTQWHRATTAAPLIKLDFCVGKPCVHGVCQNVGSSDYSCICEYGYVGRNCENMLKQCELLSPCLNGGTCADSRGSYKCDCRYGFTGQNCSKSVDVEDDANFRGDGWLELSNNVMMHDERREMIGFEISTNETDGLILWHGDESSRRLMSSYMALAVTDGYVEFQYNLGSGPAILRMSSFKVDDGKRHRIILKRHERDGSMELDGEHIETGTSDGLNRELEIRGNVYIGGVPEYSMTGSRYHVGFSGCIHTLEVQDSGAIDMGKYVLRGKNVAPCSRARHNPSSLVKTDTGKDAFDPYDWPTPINIPHPKSTFNKASIFINHRSLMYITFLHFSVAFFLRRDFLVDFITVCVL
ncbi:basement membrane-specific heparan sulfate proteoglycan core protein-like isoform X2 [Phymastichus coffea]|uniref:basement membrane-specific heparan sulfate proteoglycan core protein-like isoform X2 n=1 Tax=Phymastichus coffea TaxID=108790 RepID=UPI00273B8A75|nr:basement membrane-specific heparan sulfate proteoglycan core protein-like isoform X2 [Phymastichus coffea]